MWKDWFWHQEQFLDSEIAASEYSLGVLYGRAVQTLLDMQDRHKLGKNTDFWLLI